MSLFLCRCEYWKSPCLLLFQTVLYCERYSLIRPIEETLVLSSSEIIPKTAGPAAVAYSFIKFSSFSGFLVAFVESFIITVLFCFRQVMQTVCHQQRTGEDFAVTMGVNAFRGFMNEFMNLTHLEEKPNKAKRKKEKKRKIEDAITYAGHTFLLTIINIPTACEICTSFFMWPIERGLVCQSK